MGWVSGLLLLVPGASAVNKATSTRTHTYPFRYVQYQGAPSGRSFRVGVVSGVLLLAPSAQSQRRTRPQLLVRTHTRFDHVDSITTTGESQGIGARLPLLCAPRGTGTRLPVLCAPARSVGAIRLFLTSLTSPVILRVLLLCCSVTIMDLGDVTKIYAARACYTCTKYMC